MKSKINNNTGRLGLFNLIVSEELIKIDFKKILLFGILYSFASIIFCILIRNFVYLSFFGLPLIISVPIIVFKKMKDAEIILAELIRIRKEQLLEIEEIEKERDLELVYREMIYKYKQELTEKIIVIMKNKKLKELAKENVFMGDFFKD